jgi:hypothetical protein
MESHFSYLPFFFWVWDHTLYRFMDLHAPGHSKKVRIREFSNCGGTASLNSSVKKNGSSGFVVHKINPIFVL